jgi:hypothetical protein
MPAWHPGRLSLRLAAAVLVVLLSPLAGVAAPGATPVAAAADGTLVSGATTYTLEPAERRVHVHVSLRVKNTTPARVTSTGTTRYYYGSWSIAVQDEATHVRATRGGKAAGVSVQQKQGYKLVVLSIQPVIFYGSTATLAIDYDLPDGGARSDSQVRVGAAFMTFLAYAHGDDQATVRVVVPPGYEVATDPEPMLRHADAEATELTTDGDVDDQEWFAVVTADRPAALRLQTLRLPIDGQDRVIEVRAWPEDETWSATVAQELSDGLPALGASIGLPWPVDGPLVVQEAYTPSLGGYAGFYIQNGAGALDLIRVTEEPDPFVVLHEASHAWFNADLLEGRWINEGLADQYASLALAAVGAPPRSPEGVDRSSEAAFALQAWPPPARIDDAATDAREQYGYHASWMVVRTLYAEIGGERMREVLAAAAGDEIAYVGRPAAETRPATLAADWRYFLDLLEARGGSQKAADLFRTWVLRPADQDALEAHERLRAAYLALVGRAGGWLPGIAIRGQIMAWNVGSAQRQIDMAGKVLDVEADIAALEAALGVADGGVLKGLFEAASTSYDESLAKARDELATLGRMRDAGAAVDAEHDALTVIGLWGTDPAARLVAAGGAYGSGDLAAARAEADHAAGYIAAAEGVGTQRVALGAGAAGLVVVIGFGFARRSGRRRRAAPAVGPAAPVAAGAPATLAARTGGDPGPEPSPDPGQGDDQA